MDAMDALLGALKLQIEWGADEALEDAPVVRSVARVAAPVALAGAGVIRAMLQPADPDLAAPKLLMSAPQRAQALADAAGTLAALRAALADFEECPLRATATNLVFAEGKPDAGLMLIGEAPGAEEDREGRPFVGPAGQLLDKMLASIGVDRESCMITNLIAWRPPGNRSPTESEVAMCLPFLLRQIALVRPRRVVALGAMAAHAVLGSKSGISRLRGKWASVEIPGLETKLAVLPMLHPGTLLHSPLGKREMWADLLLLRRTLDQIVA
jgi:DNA polymerase